MPTELRQEHHHFFFYHASRNYNYQDTAEDYRDTRTAYN